MDLGKFYHVVSHYAFHEFEFNPDEINFNDPWIDYLCSITNGTAAWLLTEKAIRSPESDIDLIKAVRFEAANLLVASSLPVDGQSGEHRKFLWAAAAAAVVHCGKFLIMGQLTGNQSMGPVGNGPLPVAAFSGDEQMVRILLGGGIDVNDCHTYFGTALYAAVFGGHETIVRLLLDAGADVEEGPDLKERPDAETETRNTQSPLNLAATIGHESIVRLLLENGASTSAEFKDPPGRSFGNTPLHQAADQGHVGVVRILLESGSEIGFSSWLSTLRAMLGRWQLRECCLSGPLNYR
jgi:hypothetical protein